MKGPKILAVASAVDLDFRYGCTPAWWQLWKGMYEAGADLIVTPYRGRAVESPWWRTAENPCYREGELFASARDAVARLKGDRYLRRAEDSPDETLADKATLGGHPPLGHPALAQASERLVERERPRRDRRLHRPDGALRGIPAELRERYGVPVVFYDGDAPMSFPEFGGMDTGFNWYHGADPGEYDLVVSNSEGPSPRLLELGARRAEAVFWGADPSFFAPQPVEKRYDVFFNGYGDKFRRDWMKAFVGEPSRALPSSTSRSAAATSRATPAARARSATSRSARSPRRSRPRGSTSTSRARSHASVFASSTCRPFELAACGAAIVTNPVEGIERWFEPGREILVANDADEALAHYRELLDDPAPPRSSAVAPASASSTSTPTPSGRSDCST